MFLFNLNLLNFNLFSNLNSSSNSNYSYNYSNRPSSLISHKKLRYLNRESFIFWTPSNSSQELSVKFFRVILTSLSMLTLWRGWTTRTKKSLNSRLPKFWIRVILLTKQIQRHFTLCRKSNQDLTIYSTIMRCRKS